MKSTIVLDTGYSVSELVNASSCITTGLFNDKEKFVGSEIEGNGFQFMPITKIPIIIFKKNKDWSELINRAQKNNLKYVIFTKEAQLSKNYDDYIKKVKNKTLDDLQIMGIGVIGNIKMVNKFSGDLPLYK